jgi:elongator complex protein 2
LPSENAPLLKVETFNTPPNDIILSSRTLWPELNKLYGHGYEVISLATHGNIIASASKGLT